MSEDKSKLHLDGKKVDVVSVVTSEQSNVKGNVQLDQKSAMSIPQVDIIQNFQVFLGRVKLTIFEQA